jgi:hypothetical protein
VRITIHPKYKNQEEAILQLVKTFFGEGDLVVKGSRNTIKTNFLGTEKLSIKFFQKPGIFKSLIYSFFRSTKAKRSFDYANYLLEHGIPTPFPVSFIEERGPLGLLGESFYICHQLEYDFTIRELIHDPLFPERKEILEQFTEFTFKMHEANVNFLDHSPGNTLIVNKGNSKYDFFLVDLNRMKFENLSIEKRMDNFKKMWLSKGMVQIIAKKYAELSNEPVDKLLHILMEKSQQFKRKTARKKYLKRRVGK